MRQNHLRNLRQVYEARQQLNLRVSSLSSTTCHASCRGNDIQFATAEPTLQAMSLMLPTTEQSNVKDLDGKMACMSLRGYSNCARQSVELDEILNSIRENLRLEQKNVMEMNFVTMHRLMSPLQVRFASRDESSMNQAASLCHSILDTSKPAYVFEAWSCIRRLHYSSSKSIQHTVMRWPWQTCWLPRRGLRSEESSVKQRAGTATRTAPTLRRLINQTPASL